MPTRTVRGLAALAIGLVAGAALGVAARAWMRLISEDPEFTWSGTLFIIGGFAVFGLAQAVVAQGRGRVRGRGGLSALRALGGVGMLPLFVAAGAIMAPTVIAGGLARSHPAWPRSARAVATGVAALPVASVSYDLVSSFGWGWRSLAGTAGLLAVYAAIIWATGPTLRPLPDRQPMPSWTRWAVVAGVAVLILLPLGLGGLQ